MRSDYPIKEKMAVIFHGIVGGMDGRNGVGPPVNISDCAKTIKYNILSTYDCDVFTHSWSTAHAEEIIKLYHPVKMLFQPQEYFGFGFKQITDDTITGQPYRTVSRYTSLERAMQLKNEYEEEHQFIYKWVLALRYDLVFFNKLDLTQYNPNFMYISSEPHWEINGMTASVYHDILFLSSSDIMNNFIGFPAQLLSGVYNPVDAHNAVCMKILSIFNGDHSMVPRTFKRYDDVETYRFIIHPEQNPVGHAYGALEVNSRFHELINKINNETNEEK